MYNFNESIKLELHNALCVTFIKHCISLTVSERQFGQNLQWIRISADL